MTSGTQVQLPLTTLPLNTMTPYLRARVGVAGGVLRWDSWRTFLGFVPVRRNRLDRPMAEVSGVRSRTWAHGDRLVAGGALVVGAGFAPSRWSSVAMLAGAGLMFLMAPTAQLVVRDERGHPHRLSVCVRHRLDVDLIAAALADLTPGAVRPPRR